MTLQGARGQEEFWVLEFVANQFTFSMKSSCFMLLAARAARRGFAHQAFDLSVYTSLVSG